MTSSNPPLPSLILSNCARKTENLKWMIIWISFPRLGVLEIISTSTIRTSFCRNHFGYRLLHRNWTFSVFSPKYATRSPITYTIRVKTDVLFNIRILKTIGHGKNWLCQRKLEIAIIRSYMWGKPMPDLWRFLYIATHVTLHTKPDAQKVNLRRRKHAQCLY